MPYSIDNFIVPISSDDRVLNIRDISGSIRYTLSPFSVTSVFISDNNIIKIKTKGTDILINLDFDNNLYAKTALKNLQSGLDTLRLKIPFAIERGIENYISGVGVVGPTGPQGAKGATGSTGPQGPTGPSINLSGVTYSRVLITDSNLNFASYPFTASFGSTDSIVSRDSSGNSHTNNFVSSVSGVTASGTFTMSVSSSRISNFSGGSGTASVKLPDATTLPIGHYLELNNNASGSLYVYTSGGASLLTMYPSSCVNLILLDNTTQAGQWDYHWLISSNLTMPYLASVAILGVSNSVATQSIFNVVTAGIYQANVSMFAGSISSGGTVQPQISWTDPNGTQHTTTSTQFSTPLPLSNMASGYAQGAYSFYSGPSQSISYSLTRIGGTIPAATWSAYIVLQRLL